jgi:DNA mismatch repair ATPase MutS
LSQFENKAAALSLPLCIPIISTQHDGVFFKNLVPISLVGSNLPQIIPISLDRINGQMVGLTGRHGGGKTTIGKNVLQNVYFALSGLPVFAESFHTDVKTVLGAVTNDEGGGSTATVFVQKVTNLMKEILEVPPHESLVFIDEIGKGTQHGTGLELGKAILFTLSKGGNSVLFNTQTLELAEYAQESLNAVCYKANKKFEFTKGISGGELGELVKEIGLDKFLRK